MATAQDLIDSAAETLEPFAALFAGVKVAEAEADKFRYQAQVEALRAQLSEPEFDAQDVREEFYSAGPGLSMNSPVAWLGLAALAVYLISRG